MSNNSKRINIYKNVIVNGYVTINSGETISSAYSCVSSLDDNDNQYHGASSIRAIVIPKEFTPGDITFLSSNSEDDDFRIVALSDSSDVAIYKIPITSTLLADLSNEIIAIEVAVVAYAFDFIKFIRIECSNPQDEDINIGLVLAPIYQGVA